MSLPKPLYDDGWVKQYCGDALKVLPQLEPECVDCLATDPPYGLSFMGKDWDKAVPSVAIWRECLRVLKPGAFGFVMCIPRQDCLARMIVNLQDAGFETGFTSLYWTYASGFPKAQNIGKAVDKRLPRQGLFLPFANHYANCRKVKGLTHAQICAVGRFYENYNHGGASVNWEQGYNVPTLEQWKTLQPLLGLSLEYLPLVEREEAKREVISRQPMTIGIGGNSLRMGSEKVVDIPATPEAKALDGSYAGFQPKPAVEVILVCMKPLSEKTYVDQALKNGKGVTWLDQCRIPSGNPYPVNTYGSHGPEGCTALRDGTHKGEDYNSHLSQGRFPANLLVSDDVLNDGRVRHGSGIYQQGGNVEWYGGKSDYKHTMYSDSVSFSRYFDLDKWADTLPFLITPKASKRERNQGCEELEEKQVRYEDGSWGSLEIFSNRYTEESGNPTGRGKTPLHRNNHPTVKPLKLMAYLITLGSREGDTVLDPFMGTGTTLLACQKMGRRGIGIEIEERYCEIAAKRMAQKVMPL